MLDVSLTDPLGDLEIARVERGHEIGVDKQGRYEVPGRALLRTLRKLPEGINDLDVSLRIGPQADFVALATEMIAANVDHAGIVLVSSRFRTDDFHGIADAIEQATRRYPGGLPGVVLYLARPA